MFKYKKRGCGESYSLCSTGCPFLPLLLLLCVAFIEDEKFSPQGRTYTVPYADTYLCYRINE